MSLLLLNLIGQEITTSSWDPTNKNMFWTACFFGFFRLDEILPKSERIEPEILTWNQVWFTQRNSVALNIRFPNIICNYAGDFVDISEIKHSSFCPYSALKNLANSDPLGVAKNPPVFWFKKRTNLTTTTFTTTMILLLSKHIGDHAKTFSGHSFRAGIPSALANTPNLASDNDILVWGKWSGDSYKSYTRLKHNATLAIFNKIISM
jgi:hypothetical protein